MDIDRDSMPSTIKSAVDAIVASLNENDCNFIRSTGNPCVIHHSTGRSVRNNWSLWSNDTPIKRDAVTNYGIAHADDISGLIWAWVWAIVRNENFDPKQHCDAYRVHWARYGLDSLAAGGWPVDRISADQERRIQMPKRPDSSHNSIKDVMGFVDMENDI